MFQFRIPISFWLINLILISSTISLIDCGKKEKGGHTIIVTASGEKEKCKEKEKIIIPVPIPVPTYQRHGRSHGHFGM